MARGCIFPCHLTSADIVVFARKSESYGELSLINSTIEKLDGNSFTCYLSSISESGIYDTHIYYLARGGLIGSYYADDSLLSSPSGSGSIKSRVDASIHFRWGEDEATSVRWHGFLTQSNMTECCTIYVKAKNVRLWVGGYFIIDYWNQGTGTDIPVSGYFRLKKLELYEIILEVSEVTLGSDVQFMWTSSECAAPQVIPSDSLVWKNEIDGSPFLISV